MHTLHAQSNFSKSRNNDCKRRFDTQYIIEYMLIERRDLHLDCLHSLIQRMQYAKGSIMQFAKLQSAKFINRKDKVQIPAPLLYAQPCTMLIRINQQACHSQANKTAGMLSRDIFNT